MLPSDARTAPFGWMSRGACQGEDPELFFPIAVKGSVLRLVSAAKAVCQALAARAACLSYGLETSQDGIWGGTTREERRACGSRPPGRRGTPAPAGPSARPAGSERAARRDAAPRPAHPRPGRPMVPEQSPHTALLRK